LFNLQVKRKLLLEETREAHKLRINATIAENPAIGLMNVEKKVIEGILIALPTKTKRNVTIAEKPAISRDFVQS